jgi:DtxR family transcriptional regulator, Mn-dependent transcriptional regulator
MTDEKKYPIPSAEQEDIEEALGVIWHKFEGNVRAKSAILPVLESGVDGGIYPLLLKRGYITESGGDVVLSAEGEKLAKDITRRHRLAERLLSDVLSLEQKAIDINACQLEHIISPEVSESICTLLGHPRQCPHGERIPEGGCCRRAEDRVEPIVLPLDKLVAGEEGRIAYVLLQDHPELHKLLSLGVVPGTPVHLHQTFPTFVLQIGENQLALEESVARNIYIRKS